MSTRQARLVLSCGLSLAAPMFASRAVVAAPAATVQVAGAVAAPGAWDAARLQHDLKADVRTVRYTLKGQMHTAHCVPLVALLGVAGPQVNPRIKNHALQFVVVAQGRDGYAAAFSLAEMQPAFGHAPVWLALDRDGRPLPADDGPVELLVPGDTKAGRWVHGLAALTVVDEARATEGRAHP